MARTKAAGGKVFVQVLTVGDLAPYDGKPVVTPEDNVRPARKRNQPK